MLCARTQDEPHAPAFLPVEWHVNTSTTQRTKKTIEKCLLTYFAVSKFVLYDEIEPT